MPHDNNAHTHTAAHVIINGNEICKKWAPTSVCQRTLTVRLTYTLNELVMVKSFWNLILWHYTYQWPFAAAVVVIIPLILYNNTLHFILESKPRFGTLVRMHLLNGGAIFFPVKVMTLSRCSNFTFDSLLSAVSNVSFQNCIAYKIWNGRKNDGFLSIKFVRCIKLSNCALLKIGIHFPP